MKTPALAAAVLVAALAGPAADQPGSASQQTPGDRAAQLEEYTNLFVSLAEQALAHPRLASPMPCAPHWLAGNDHVVVAVSQAGAAAGLEPGDRLLRIGTTTLTGRADGLWDVALRALTGDPDTYTAEISRGATTLPLSLPCAAGDARRLHEAERAMWSAVTMRQWSLCIDGGKDMIAAFGRPFSPPLMIMSRCASAAGGSPDPALTSALGHALLDELVAHPAPSPDLREQLFLTLKDLDALARTGGEDYASRLRERMTALGIQAPSR